MCLCLRFDRTLDRHARRVFPCRSDGPWGSLIRRGVRAPCVDNEEFLAGVCCLAVPVKDHRGRTVAGLAVSPPSARFPLEKARSYFPDLRACAALIAEHLSTRR